MTLPNKIRIRNLLKAIETGETEAVEVVNEAEYVQHNPMTEEGSEGLAALFARLAKTSPRVNMVRGFEDGDYVFAHMEYDFSKRRIGFEVFRFEDGFAVEHWDNIQSREGPNRSGHSMVDGETEATDLDRTEANRARIRAFLMDVLIGKDLLKLDHYVDPGIVEHNPGMTDGLLSVSHSLADPGIDYLNIHRVLAEGNFVLSVCEGNKNRQHTSFYDLFRLADGMIVEHWDTTETIPPRDQWKNDNGKF